MRPAFIFLIGFLTIFPLGCTFSPNPLNWFKSVPDEERFSYQPSEAPGEETQEAAPGPETPEEASALPETPEEAILQPETPEEALVGEPTGVPAAAEPPTFTIVYYARGPGGRTRVPPSGKPRPNAVYKRAKEAHMTHNLEEGVYAPYYQHVRNRIKSHWNFLYSDIEGISYATRNNLPIVIEARVSPAGLISDVGIADAAGNAVLAAIIKGAVETALLDRFPPEIKDKFIRLRFQFYFGE